MPNDKHICDSLAYIFLSNTSLFYQKYYILKCYRKIATNDTNYNKTHS